MENTLLNTVRTPIRPCFRLRTHRKHVYISSERMCEKKRCARFFNQSWQISNAVVRLALHRISGKMTRIRLIAQCLCRRCPRRISHGIDRVNPALGEKFNFGFIYSNGYRTATTAVAGTDVDKLTESKQRQTSH